MRSSDDAPTGPSEIVQEYIVGDADVRVRLTVSSERSLPAKAYRDLVPVVKELEVYTSLLQRAIDPDPPF